MAAGEDVIGGAPTAGAGRRRIALIDAARGLAILAMVVYHVGWDLYVLGFITTDVTTEPAWVLFQRAILSSFLVLVGVSLALAHGDGIRWRPFWRRFAVIAAAALLTSIGTAIVFPDYFVYFGVLHAIALFSLLGLAFVRASFWVLALGIVALTVPPALVSSSAMSAKPLSWIGFWPFPPMTTDIVPVFPWFGVVLVGIAAARVAARLHLLAGLERLALTGPVGRVLVWLGRWSLVIYLLHQPLIYGGLSLLAPAAPDAVAFTQSCEQSCQAGGAGAEYCARYCLCALEQVTAQSLWDEVAADPQGRAVTGMRRLCTAMADAGAPK